MAQRPGLGNWLAFLCAAFVVTGLAGVFATYAAPLPLERLGLRERAIDSALAALGTPGEADSLAAIARLTGGPALSGPDLPGRLASLRAAQEAEFTAEEAALLRTLRLLILTVTVAAGVFGCLAMSVVGRSG